ncbi:Lrp/AsnC ligand binding domain-containing protein [Glycomyces terrestris]|uniref:Lrp/AsnC family transcriptional regulator n=1 Tax=Glycomyces terrestris TaxID=2493553 RepID=A0A426V0A4_9ACTN|nr:Lrp/AsnC ligand binding domain-containing protein [Glycomyces terrestris]RRS00286.1 Lrp/AsnC family transcriptional regulator [Glycomyces terrestris]
MAQVQAYMLIQTEVGMAGPVSEAVSEIEGVVRVDAVTGPYDVVVLTEASTGDPLGHAVVSRVQRVAGITRTLTCSILEI